jgi:hypothetical protein
MSTGEIDSKSEPSDDQAALFPEQTITETEEAPATVWVVASRRMDDPHPWVEAVYDSEEAAREHKRELADNSFQHGVVAWDVFERPVRGETDV